MSESRVLRPGPAISTLILGGYVLISIAVLGLGWFAARNMEQLRAITSDLYVHPFAVSNAATDMKGALFQLRNHMIQIVLIRNAHDNLKLLASEAEGFSGTARADLAVIKANFLGDMQRVKELEIKLDQWDAIRAEILSDASKGDFAQAEHLVRTVGTSIFFELVPLIEYVQTFARERGKRYAEEAEQHTVRIISHMRWVVVFLGAFIVATAFALLLRASAPWRIYSITRQRMIPSPVFPTDVTLWN